MALKTWIGTASGFVGDWGEAANWSPSGVPVSTDDVILANSSQDVLSNLDQSAVALNSLTIDQSYTGLLAPTQSQFLEIGAVICELGQVRATSGTQTGSKRLNLDLGSTTASTIRVFNTASQSIDTNRQPTRLRAVNASTTLSVFSGAMALSEDSENSSTVGTITVNGGSMNGGSSITLTNLLMNGGSLTLTSSITGTATIKGGTLNLLDSITASTIGTLIVEDGGTVNHNASGTITTFNMLGGTTDLTPNQVTKTVTNFTPTGGTLITDSSLITFTNITFPATTRQTQTYQRD